MDLKQLKYFVTVAEEGTISAAAKKLFMSQPPLSIQMKLLEQELGCPLFERGQKHIRLTDTGKLLYDRAQNILKMEAEHAAGYRGVLPDGKGYHTPGSGVLRDLHPGRRVDLRIPGG